MFTRTVLRAGLFAAAVLCVSAPGALAAGPISIWDSAGGATVGWVQGTDAPGNSDHQAIKITVPGSPAGAYAGFVLANTPASAPTSAPSFELLSNLTGAASGSPRLIVSFANGNMIYAAPQNWTAGAWSTVGGSAPDWTESGTASGCVAQSNITYAAALTCNSSQRVSEVYMVDDTPGSSLYVDEIRFDGTLITDQNAVKSGRTPDTHLAATATVSGGVGSLGAGCGLKHGTCKFSLILRAKKSGRAVKVGTITGRLLAEQNGNLELRLNQTGQAMLAATNKLVAKVTGQWPKGRGPHRKTITITG
ncbi:MAG TPA: hypothetical protein VFP55_11955 [Solirubrobacteraceae bacterium]|nr:hypothetical protein [Solirubrobacteraceae bacterium]